MKKSKINIAIATALALSNIVPTINVKADTATGVTATKYTVTNDGIRNFLSVKYNDAKTFDFVSSLDLSSLPNYATGDTVVATVVDYRENEATPWTGTKPPYSGQLGLFKVDYKITDGAGKDVTTTVEVSVVDNDAPVITTTKTSATVLTTDGIKDGHLKGLFGIDINDNWAGAIGDYKLSSDAATFTPLTIDYSKPGTYDFWVYAWDNSTNPGITDANGNKGNFATKQLHLKVMDSNGLPTITAENKTLLIGDTWTSATNNPTASDKEDGDLTAQIKVVSSDIPVDSSNKVTTAGNYSITYEVSDKDGNKATTTATVTVKASNDMPTISAINLNLTVGDSWDTKSNCPTASDKEDGDLTAQIKVTSHNIPVDSNGKITTAGNYIIAYEVKDKDGNSATIKANVNVTDVATPTNDKPVVTASNVILNYGDKWSESMHNAKANDKEDGDLTAQIKVSHNIPLNLDGTTSKSGTYTVTFDVKDKDGNTATTTATVTVKPSTGKPTIVADNLSVKVGDKWTPSMHNAKATDAEDGDLTAQIKVVSNNIPVDASGNITKAGTYAVTFEVTDRDGYQDTTTATVIVSGAPVIEAQDCTITVGDSWNLSLHKATATDAEDGDLTSQIKVVSRNIPLDMNSKAKTEGTYYVNLEVSDKAGNKATKTVKVEVKKQESKNIPKLQGKEVYLTVGDKWFLALHELAATDVEDGDLLSSVVIDSTNLPMGSDNIVTKEGIYTVVVGVKDKDGNRVSTPLTVTILKKDTTNPTTPTDNSGSGTSTNQSKPGSTTGNGYTVVAGEGSSIGTPAGTNVSQGTNVSKSEPTSDKKIPQLGGGLGTAGFLGLGTVLSAIGAGLGLKKKR